MAKFTPSSKVKWLFFNADFVFYYILFYYFNLLYYTNNQTAIMDQVATIYKISQILGEAFKEVNNVCAHYLADQSVQNGAKH